LTAVVEYRTALTLVTFFNGFTRGTGASVTGGAVGAGVTTVGTALTSGVTCGAALSIGGTVSGVPSAFTEVSANIPHANTATPIIKALQQYLIVAFFILILLSSFLHIH
jgi:ABC-type dipeptide/oligopeptide/nickel transport system permease subunit